MDCMQGGLHAACQRRTACSLFIGWSWFYGHGSDNRDRCCQVKVINNNCKTIAFMFNGDSCGASIFFFKKPVRDGLHAVCPLDGHGFMAIDQRIGTGAAKLTL